MQKKTKRNAVIIRLFRSGKKLREIGALYGISHQAVRQIIVRAGIDTKSGGQAILSAMAAARDRERRESRCNALYGCSTKERDSISWKTRSCYLRQKRNALQRGIGFKLSLHEWVEIWESSGVFHLRGRGEGYVMARHGDTGPYAVGNVYICTAVQNTKDSYVFKPASSRRKPAQKKVAQRVANGL